MGLKAVSPASAAVNSSQIVGTKTNDNAAAGIVGEYIESVVVAGSAVSLASGGYTVVTQFDLTAGDWDVSGNLLFVGGTGVVVQDFVAGCTTNGTTLGNTESVGRVAIQLGSGLSLGASNYNVPFGPMRFSLATTTTIYMKGRPDFTVGTLGGAGTLRARRVR